MRSFAVKFSYCSTFGVGWKPIYLKLQWINQHARGVDRTLKFLGFEVAFDTIRQYPQPNFELLV